MQRLDEEASGRPTRVLILSDPFPPYDRGGAERIAHYHAHALRERGYDVAVVTSYEAKSGRKPTIGTEQGLKVFRAFSPTSLTASEAAAALDNAAKMGLQLWNPSMQRRLEAIAIDFRPDLVHAHHIPRISYRAFTRVAPGAPHVLTFHTYHYECPKGGLYRKGRQSICGRKPLPCRAYLRLMTRQLAGIDRIVAISRFIEGRLLEAGHDRSKVVYIPNGVPGLEERQPTPPPQSKEVLFVGRIVHNKGLRELTRAVSEIADPELRLNVVGDGELLATLRRETRSDPRIRYRGWLGPEQVAEFYRSCRVVVVPSLWHEVMNTVVCEAQSWSRPVVATRVGGNEDLIADDVSGILCPPGDVRALRRAIVRLLDDDHLSAAIGRAGFEHVQRFGMRRHIDAIEELYGGLGHSARAPRTS